MVKKLILLGFGLVLLVGLPLALFLLQQQTQPTTKAAAVTTFSFDGPTSVTTGQAFSLNLNVDPGGQNQVSFIKFTFSYDSSKLAPGSSFITIDTSTYTVLASPAPSCNGTQCTVSRTISIGTNQNAIIKSKTTIAVVNFTAQATTDTAPTQLTFVDGQNQALSVGSADQPAENVFQSGTPFSITITSGGTTNGTTPTPTTAPTNQGTTPTPTDQGTTGGTTGGNTGGSTGGTIPAVSIDCSSFTAQPASGNSPLTTTFTTVASSPNDTISQVVINYGDGTSDTVASGSGIGTGTINNQITHTYNSTGTFTAFATVTTAGGAINPSNTCRATVTVGSATTLAGGGKLPSTGPGETILAIGAGGAILTILGGLIFLGL